MRISRRQLLGSAAAAIGVAGCDLGPPSAPEGTVGALRSPGYRGAPSPLTVLVVPPAVRLPVLLKHVAGTGEFGDMGDGGPAAQAQFRSIGGVAVDSNHQIYLSDPQANRVRRIGADGVIQTIAGTGVRDSTGDGGPALHATVTEPTRLLVDGAGVLLIAEAHRVRQVDTEGIITTLIGDGTPGRNGDGGPAVFARVAGNSGMALDGEGTLFIAERAAHRIRRIDVNGIVTTAAGTGVPGSLGDGGFALHAELNEPVDVEVDSVGNVLIAELAGNRIRRVVGHDRSGEIHTLVGTGKAGVGGDGGLASEALLSGPQAVAVDAAGNVFIADWNNRRIRRVNPGGRIDTIAGRIDRQHVVVQAGATADLTLPCDVTVTPQGHLLVVEQGTRRLRALVPHQPTASPLVTPKVVKYQPPAPARPLPPPLTGVLIADVFAGDGNPGYDGDGGHRLSVQFAAPRGIAVDDAGRVLIADAGNHRIRRIDLDGRVWTVAGTGIPGFSGDGSDATTAQLNRPHHVVVDSDGSLFIADAGNFRVRRVSPQGRIDTVVGGNAPGSSGDGGPAVLALLREPVGVALDGLGRLYVVDAPDHRVRRVDVNGNINTIAGTGTRGASGNGGAGTEASVGFPQRVVIDSAGDVLISQLQAGVVRRLDEDGVIEIATGNPSRPAGDQRVVPWTLDAPIGLAADRVGGFYVVESGAGTVTAVLEGSTRSVAGDPIGTGQPGANARDVPLFTAIDIAISGEGTCYVLEARGIVWRISRADPKQNSEVMTSARGAARSTSTPSVAPSGGLPQRPAEHESAAVRSVTLALDLDSAERAVSPALDFHPGERVGVSIEFTDIADRTRLGIRWYTGEALVGSFHTDPVGASAASVYGFWFFLPDAAVLGRWFVEVTVGDDAVSRVDFVVSSGQIRIHHGSD